MSDVGAILTASLALYALVTGIFLISENRRPQATLAWMLAFFFAPGIGMLVYFLFGRDRKAFSKESKLLRQDLEASALPVLSPHPVPPGCGDHPARRRERQPQKADDARAGAIPIPR